MCVCVQCNELVELGASIGETPAAVVKKCKLIIAMLSDPAATLSVCIIPVSDLQYFYFLCKGTKKLSFALFITEIDACFRWFLIKMEFLKKFVVEKVILTCQLLILKLPPRSARFL